MNKNEKFVITINRELGSGGRTVGRKLAEKLGVEYYDKAVIQTLTDKYNLSVEEIERLKGRNHSWWAELRRALFESNGKAATANYTLAVPGDKPFEPTSQEMFQVERQILNGIAENESCVVAGRLGFFVFHTHPNHLNVLIQASMPFRVERVMRKQNVTEEEARKTIEKVDQMRENYVKEYAKTSRYDTRNYDLVISADGNTEDQIVDIILQYINNSSK